VHFVVEPLALVLLSIWPNVGAGATDFIHFEVSVVDWAVGKSELALAVLFALEVLSFINGSIWPSFNTKAMLLIISPIALIPCAICMRVGSFAIGFIVFPLTLVDIPVSVE